MTGSDTRSFARFLGTLGDTRGPKADWLAAQSEALARIRSERKRETDQCAAS